LLPRDDGDVSVYFVIELVGPTTSKTRGSTTAKRKHSRASVAFGETATWTLSPR
jgi:hypothetical protein